MFKKVSGLVISACLASATAVAQDSPLSYSFVGAGYSVGEVVDEDFGGYTVYGSVAANENIFVLGSFTSLESDDKFFNGFSSDEISVDQFTFGIGFHSPINDMADFVATIQYADAEVEYGNLSEDGTGYVLAAGLRAKPTDVIELSAGVNYADIEDDGEAGFTLGARAYAAQNLSFGIGYGSTDDVDTFAFDVRADF